MASYKDLLRMLDEGKSPRQIMAAMRMRPGMWRRMLRGKRFQDALRIEHELAAVTAAHLISAGVHEAAERFSELLASDRPETVRKVALAVLHEGMKRARPSPARQRPPARPLPWADRMRHAPARDGRDADAPQPAGGEDDMPLPGNDEDDSQGPDA